MITVVVTANGRDNLLKRTLDSFNKYNTCNLVSDILIHDDVKDKWGQVRSIDYLYRQVKTPYIFHLEDDWEFYREGFIEKSLTILEADDKILTVWLRHPSDTNGHPVDPEYYSVYDTRSNKHIVTYQLMATHALGGVWHGYTWNPGLRRISDYYLLGRSFESFIQPGDFAALTECRIGQAYFNLGFRAAILPEGYVKHIG